MLSLNQVKEVLTGKRPLIDVWHYIVGNYRYWLYYKRAVVHGNLRGGSLNTIHLRHPLMRQHIYEQIEYRLRVMNPVCFEQGQCIKCGCETTKLQMASKRCDGFCYPALMTRVQWQHKVVQFEYTKINGVKPKVKIMWLWDKDTYTAHIETNTGYVPMVKEITS